MNQDKEVANELYQKGTYSFALRNYERAIQHFTEAINNDSNNYRFYVYRAFSKYYLDQTAESVSDIDRAIQLCTQQTQPDLYIQYLGKVRLSILEETLVDPLQIFLELSSH